MTRHATLMLTVACALPLACTMSRAADGATEPPPVPSWSFGELRTWHSGIDANRLPVDLQPLREVGNRSLLPPRAARSPWQLRLAGMLEVDDNLLLSPQNRRKGAALVLSPGLNWRDEGPRHRIEVDASVDLLRGVEGDYDASRMDAATVQAGALVRTSETTTLSYLGTLLRSHDPAGVTPIAPLPGGTPDQRFQADYQRHELDLGWRSGPRTDLSARWVGTWARSRSPDFIRTQVDSLELGARWQADALLRLGLLLRGRHAGFADRPDQQDRAAWLEAEHQWSPTLLGKAAIGAASPEHGGARLLWRASLSQAFASGQWDLALERDVSAPAGLGRLYVLRSVRAGAAWRIGERSRLEVSASGSEYRPLEGDSGGGTVRTWRPRIAFTHAFGNRSWLSVRAQGVDDRAAEGGQRRQGERLLVTLLKTF